MADAVLPEPVLPPTVAMVGTDQHRSVLEAVQQSRELAVDPFQTGDLPPGTFRRTAMLISEGYAGAGPALPASSFVPVGHVGFTHIKKHESRLFFGQLRQTFINP